MNFSQEIRFFRVLIYVVACFAFISPVAAQQNTASAGVTKAASAETISEVRNELAKLLGLSPESLLPDTDLIKDLGVDRATLHYKLLRLYAKYEIKPPAIELTTLGRIAAHIDHGEEMFAAPPVRGDRPKTAAKPKKERKPAAPARPSRGPASVPDEEALEEEAADSDDKRDKTVAVSGDTDPFFVQKVYYATNRKPTGDNQPDDFFGEEPIVRSELHYGLASVNIPRSHRTGKLETPWLGISWFRSRSKHIFIDGSLKVFDAKAFYKSLKAEGNGSEPMLLYIHGFNTDFSEAVTRAAQISVDLEFKGVPLAFSWPSNGRADPLSYRSDESDVRVSVHYLEQFLADLHKKFPKRTIHAIAHSMGTQALTFAMLNLARRGFKEKIFASVILAAPDLDAGKFANPVAQKIKPLADHWAIYASNNDFALNLSARFNGTPRLGIPLTVIEGMQIIDATKVEVTPWSVPEGHSYYATKKKVIDDMIEVLAGKLPKARGLVAKTHQGGAVWEFK